MIQKSFLSFVVATVALAAIPPTGTLSRAQTAPPEPAKRIAPILQPFVDDHTLAGAVTLVASKDKVLSLEAVGYADIAADKPMSTDCLFWIASQSKPITAAALMILVDEGKVKVEDPVEKYLPEFKEQWVRAERDKDHVLLKKPGHSITVKNLLTHTSGLPFKSPIEQPTLDQFPLALRVQSYAMLPLEFEPDGKYQYSNAGINTAGRIIEVVGGMPYEEFLDKRLFQPLGMKDTTFWPDPEQLRRLAKSYKPSADKKSLEETTVGQLKYPLDDRARQPMPAGGLFSTASDLSLFYRMIANGGTFAGRRYLSEGAVKEMTSKQTGDLPTPYGYGFATGGGRIGHGGAYNTNSSYDPQSQLITIFLVQHAGWVDEGKKILPAFHKAAKDAFATTAASSSGAAIRPASRDNVIVFKEEGRYGGWPANQGPWSWGNEIVVGFTAAWYKASPKDHAVDRGKHFNGPRDEDRAIEATIWNPAPADATATPPAQGRRLTLSDPVRSLPATDRTSSLMGGKLTITSVSR